MKKIKILTITLVVIAITMVAFWGVYTQVQNRMENQVKDYSEAMDLKGSRIITLAVNTENTTTIKDAEGKIVEEELTDEQIKEKGYTKEETPNNKEEVKNVENYKLSKKIIENRLKKLGITNYLIKLNEQTGEITIELPENDHTDNTISNIKETGKFEIVDSETNEVLMNNHDIKTAKVMYGSGSETTSAGTSVYLDIEFNKEGKKKLEEISSQYVKIEETETEENTANEGNETTDENANNEDNKKETEKKVTMKIDDETIMSTSFEEPVKIGRLQLSVGSSATDTETLHGYVEQATSMATVLDTGNMPIQYDLDQNQYVLSDITANGMQIGIYVVLALVVLGAIILLLKYKAKGALGIISFVGFISLFMLVVRYTNVELSIEGLLGIVIAFILDYMLVSKLLAKTDNQLEVYQDFFVKIIPIIIIAITFCFAGWVPLSSFGMVMFWGFVLIAIYNSIVTNSLLKINAGKEK